MFYASSSGKAEATCNFKAQDTVMQVLRLELEVAVSRALSLGYEETPNLVVYHV